QLNNLGREIKKVNEKVYAAQVGCELCKGPHYTKYCPLKEERKTLEESYYTQFDVPFQQGGQYRAAALGFYQRNNGNPSYQERRQTMEESLSKFMAESAKRHEENSNLIKKIRAATDSAIRNQGASIKALKIQIGQMNKVLQERGSRSLPISIETNPRDHVKLISTTDEADTFLICRLGKLAPTKLIIELADRTVKHPKGIAKNMLVGIDKFVFPIYFIVLDMAEDIKTPLIIGRPFLSTAHAKIDVFKRKITLRVRGDYIELNDLNEPLELRRNQVEDFGMGDIIVGRPFFREACVKTRQFDGMITIYKGNDSVTYQMARSHSRFKHLTNAQCNKMRPLLKVSAHDELKGISHPYKKLKRFYKGVLNLGPKYIKDEKVEEWLTRGHVSVHEME
ncbi:DNA-directed DNA polymerase, partial [Tanacetum coccineum]